MQSKHLLIIGITVIIVIAFFLGSKITSIPANRQEVQTVASQNSSSSTSLSIGQQAPDFSVTTLEREVFRLSDKKGKTVILFGMAGWCGTCIAEGRVLTKIKNDYANKGLEVIGVAFTKGDNEDFLKEFKRIGGIDIPLALDTDRVTQKYNLTRLETTYIINEDGAIVYKDEQNTLEETYRKELEKTL